MYLALIKKELREVLPTVAIAAVAYLIAISAATGNWLVVKTPLREVFSLRTQEVVFASDTFLDHFLLIAACYATVLGFQQSLAEEWRGTFRLLLHRPMARIRIVLVKLTSGLVVLLVTGSIAIVALALWAATPGMQPAPFYWSMTVPTFFVLISAPILYLGAFLSAVRPSRWYATKLIPWVVSIGVFWLAFELSQHDFFLWAFGFLSVGMLLLLANTVWVIGHRDFA